MRSQVASLVYGTLYKSKKTPTVHIKEKAGVGGGVRRTVGGKMVAVMSNGDYQYSLQATLW